MPTLDTSLTVRLPGDLADRLHAAVRRRGMSRAAAVREALELYLPDGGPSFMAEGRALAGRLTGPPDLSGNRRYLKGYGS